MVQFLKDFQQRHPVLAIGLQVVIVAAVPGGMAIVFGPRLVAKRRDIAIGAHLLWLQIQSEQ